MTETIKPKISSDPFFYLPRDSTWNACIGVQGDALNYVEGYLEAAIELADTLLEKKLYAKRDTLVLPILYNARHAIELTQKFVIATLNKAGACNQATPHDHDIAAHAKMLKDAAVGDEALRTLIDKCEPFVASLARIDDDGQALRYAVRQDGQQSMADKSLANIVVIRKSLEDLGSILSKLKDRVIDFAEERQTKTFTRDCSRTDLFEIARLLPQRPDWVKPTFDTTKASIRERFGLSNGKFSDALNVIQVCRETKAIIGVETPLTHLEDKDILMALDEWSKLHPANRQRAELGADYFDAARLDQMLAQGQIAAQVNAALSTSLSLEKVADLQTVFYIGRDRISAEYYEARLEGAIRALKGGNLQAGINHLMTKTNFKAAVSAAVGRLGRLQLAASLDAQR